ncbi:sugar phosphate isomerase/epimerase family protein [Mahella australiensis]|uniref:Xylose isomerase domain-containing protein TIM barrel n=1 Tax=Mahella australiensis (strain DSM 15567 / CIP 107919 / 50-1 BON) TaxID=697281 RepID=F4A0P7_MAHA5|nr:sugar phosphate isomerase/epimerase [Mahella australiensis]AEE96943.1 Xylose isomerase domain-containing protein TIM barrel [Mahella australiensis 50-1 BON]
MYKIGLQLYSIKEETERDFFGALKKVADIGYDGVEFAGYFNTPALDLKNALGQYGLDAAGSHIGIDLLTNELPSVIEYSKTIEDPFIICPWLPENMRDSKESCKRTAQLLTDIGRECNKNGIQFGYHNHDFEFRTIGDNLIFDLLFENSDPEAVKIELDTFWVEYTGYKSVDIIDKYGSRCICLHIKDMKSWEERVNTEVGCGVMDFKSIIAAGKKYGVKWYTVEQEEFERPLFESVEISCKNLKQLLA